MKGLIVLRPASLRSLWRVRTANNYTNKTMLYIALERRTRTMHYVKPMAVLSYLLQFYLVLWLFSGWYGNNLSFYSCTLKAAPISNNASSGCNKWAQPFGKNIIEFNDLSYTTVIKMLSTLVYTSLCLLPSCLSELAVDTTVSDLFLLSTWGPCK